ncbi:phage tail tube protein [Solimonas flava]|uniref:phage tail tube protein n=1 Tax=Solimonas flava TaxID=415849 RepID=UPI0004297D35|nr:phage tail tube protein [Solimonas flava]
MAQHANRARIRVNGKLFDTMPNPTFDPGGVIAQTKMSAYGAHWGDQLNPSRLEASVVATADVSVAEIAAWRDATLTVEYDTGKIYTVPKAWTVGTPQLSNGEIRFQLEGEPAEEHG